ncbi:MAG TPA: AI-2E family transporter [Anaerolineales bacterium]|jgi:predicted PurR-regulated permease PerM|nr:AI-2E family transporter [Anaerolineales bacterium]
MTSNSEPAGPGPGGESISSEEQLAAPAPMDRARYSWWWLVTAGAAALVVGLGLMGAIQLLAQPLALLVIAVTIAATLSPIVNWFDRWMPWVVALLLVYLLLILIFVGIGLIVIPPLVAQAQNISAQVPNIAVQVQKWLANFGQIDTTSLINILTSQLSNAGSSLVSLPVTIFSSIVDIVVIFFVSIYTLVAAPQMRRFILSLFPEGPDERVIGVLAEMSNAMGGYFRAAAINSIIIGLLTYLGMLVIGVHFPLVLGILAGSLELVPMMGPVIAAVPMVITALLQSPTLALIALVYAIGMHQFENQILVPNIMRSQTDISPLLVILALISGYTVGGVIGALTAIPMVAALKVVVLEVIAPAVRSRTGADLKKEKHKGTQDENPE